ncbi:class I SAM-dependent methyltransferase [Patescibacteria group bacterium]|nr:class I SAM-dependent methyltransferase [Patescibacteria group bacterium]
MNSKNILKQSYLELAPLSDGWRKEFRLHEKTLNLINEYMPSLANKRILDIGCGLGILVRALSKLGARAEGVDKHILDEWGINGVKELWREKEIKISINDFLLEPYDADSFDMIISEDVFEHLKYTQKEFMDKIYKLLRPGGIMILATPNLASFLKRARMLFGKSPYWDLKDFFLNKQPYGHIREFTGFELGQMAKLSNLEVMDVKHYNIYIKSRWFGMPKKYPGLLSFLFSSIFSSGRDAVYLIAKK